MQSIFLQAVLIDYFILNLSPERLLFIDQIIFAFFKSQKGIDHLKQYKSKYLYVTVADNTMVRESNQ